MKANDTVVITHDLDPLEVSVRIFNVDCDCGTSLSYNVTIDCDNDVSVRVDPHICEQEEE